MPSWRVERRRGGAQALHDRPLVGSRVVEVLEPVRPALVLGSTQPPDVVDDDAAASAGVEVVRRRSGGGAVLLLPGQATWLDVTIPRGDPLWDDDVAKAFHWLGRVWATAAASVGFDAHVHAGSPVEGSWSRLVCFAGLGPGEVTVGGRKLVGISQRRSREGARFQCLVLRRWDPVPLLQLLSLDDERRARAVAELSPLATGVDLSGDALVAALIGALPS